MAEALLILDRCLAIQRIEGKMGKEYLPGLPE